MHLRGDAGRKALVPRQRSCVIAIAHPKTCPHLLLDVNQFSIITELLGTPPDDVIESIASENVIYPSSDNRTQRC